MVSLFTCNAASLAASVRVSRRPRALGRISPELVPMSFLLIQNECFNQMLKLSNSVVGFFKRMTPRRPHRTHRQ